MLNIIINATTRNSCHLIPRTLMSVEKVSTYHPKSLPYSKQWTVTTKINYYKKVKKGSDLDKTTKWIRSKPRISVQTDSTLTPLTLPFCSYYFTDFYSSYLQGIRTSKATPSSKNQPWVVLRTVPWGWCTCSPETSGREIPFC